MLLARHAMTLTFACRATFRTSTGITRDTHSSLSSSLPSSTLSSSHCSQLVAMFVTTRFATVATRIFTVSATSALSAQTLTTAVAVSSPKPLANTTATDSLPSTSLFPDPSFLTSNTLASFAMANVPSSLSTFRGLLWEIATSVSSVMTLTSARTVKPTLTASTMRLILSSKSSVLSRVSIFPL